MGSGGLLDDSQKEPVVLVHPFFNQKGSLVETKSLVHCF